MYCSDCGAQSTAGLKYCKQCGANLAATTQLAENESPSGRTTSAAWAIALAATGVCLGGLGIVFTNALNMMKPPILGAPVPGDRTTITIVMITLGTATIFGVVALLIRLFSRLLLPPQERMAKDGSRETAASGYAAAQLPEPPGVMPSVTEHTTRTFDRVRTTDEHR